MKRIDSINTSEGQRPTWSRVLLLLLVGFAALELLAVPFFSLVRPEASELEAFFILKAAGFAWVALVVVRTVGWASVGLRRPVRPGSAVYGALVLLLGVASLAGGIAPEMTVSTFIALAVVTACGVMSEEVIFRGAMWEALAARGHLFVAITTSLGFGMIHSLGLTSDLPASIIAAQMCFAVGTGLTLAAVRIAAGGLWSAVGVHYVFNMLAFLASGGIVATFEPGMERNMIAAGVVLGLTGLLAAVVASRRTGSTRRPEGALGTALPNA